MRKDTQNTPQNAPKTPTTPETGICWARLDVFAKTPASALASCRKRAQSEFAAIDTLSMAACYTRSVSQVNFSTGRMCNEGTAYRTS